MSRRALTFFALSLLILAGLFLLLRSGNRSAVATNQTSPAAAKNGAVTSADEPATTTVSESTAPVLSASGSSATAAAKRDWLSYRLTNTKKTSSQLLRDDGAILLENALIETGKPLGFTIPEKLRAVGDPGSYIVQSRGPVDAAFRAALAEAGAEIVSYIPNNAFLVRADADAAKRLSSNPETLSVLAYEPVYKFKDELLKLAFEEKPLARGTKLNLLVFTDAYAEVVGKLSAMGWNTLAEDSSPFGKVITVDPGADWTTPALWSGVQLLEAATPRIAVNDLTRVRLGVATDSVATNNYFGLTGIGVLVGLNDTGVDQTHPDLIGRVFASTAGGLIDFNGHGTHVGGIIAGSGAVSTNITKARGSINSATNGQFRGMAPAAKLYVQTIGSGLGSTPDRTLQETAASTNALISNNSWTYLGSSTYSLAAASYDAAVRDSLSGRTGSQPILYVFAAGNSGGGSDEGLSGSPGSLTAPATAKNVVTVGAIELARDITNIVTKIIGNSPNQITNTSTPWKAMTSSGNQVAGFSARGNVGIGTEGDFGRFKPDVVAPGTFVISTRTQSPWDEIAYYNPTNHHYTVFRNQVVNSNSFRNYSIFLPDNAVGFTVTLFANNDSPDPFPGLPVGVRRDDYPNPFGTAEAVGINFVGVPPTLAAGPGASVGQNWFYTVQNTNRVDISYNVFTDVITTNDLGDYYTVLSNLNNSLTGTNQSPQHYYRYESGTSMSAAGVSGTLALVQQFFEQGGLGVGITNSPAMMKALLINGARSVGNLYDFQVQSSINYQGWGLPKLNNMLPSGITNAFKTTPADKSSVKLFDQSPTNALATGYSQTRFITLDEAGQSLPLRVTLAWTDPPGNPAAGVKLVNDLDLVITNRDTLEVYLGNDIPGASTFTFPWDTNSPPNSDSVNNVENIYIPPALGTNYSITVIGRRVNVNAVTAHINDIVQDYALVISSGNGEATNAITVSSTPSVQPIVGMNQAIIISVTNDFTTATFASGSLEGQHVGANTPMLVSTNGSTNQWRFYTMTNTTTFTNATFLVSQQTDLSTPRIGVFASGTDESTRRYADIDMYVSTNAALTTFDPAVIGNSFKSQTRNDLSGDEFVIFSNSPPGLNQVYYIGVKSEDQMAAEFEFWGIFSLLPLGEEDANGFVQAYPMRGYGIPDGSPSKPGGTRWISITRPSLSGISESVLRVFVTNNVAHENFGDIIGTMDHNSQLSVLNNHRGIDSPVAPGPYNFLYGEPEEGPFVDVNNIPHPVISPDGPGTFEEFTGQAPGGTWYFTFSDDALSQTGRVNEIKLKIERQCEDPVGCAPTTNVIAANGWRYFSKNIPVEATNLTVCLNIISASPQPLQLYIRKDRRPTQTAYDYTMTITGSGCLTIDKADLPPLTAGRYFIGVFNGNPTSQTFVYQATVLLGEPPVALPFNSLGGQKILDDAVTNFTTFITNDLKIAQLDVGLRIDHPRVSDLAVTLISPRGTRVLLVENRGGLDPNGFGSSVTVTNFIPVDANGGPTGQTNFIDTGSTAGSVTIDYEFFTRPDQMTVYYQGVLLYDTLMTNGAARLTLNYGPGASTLIEIRMNEFGNTNATTAWNYTVSSYNTANSYLIFTENTNKTITPVKFALPPLGGTFGAAVPISEFELPTIAQDYVNPATPDGWTVLPTNRVTVITNSANIGTNSLALRSGMIQRTLTTVPGRTYRLAYAYRKAASLDGIVGWWPGDSNTLDVVNGNNAVLGGAIYGGGKVQQGYSLDGVDDRIVAAATPQLDFGPGEDYSVEGWIRAFPAASSFGVMTILDKRSAPTSSEGLGFSLNLQNGTLAMQMCDGLVPNTTWNYYVSPGPNLQDGQLHHVAASVQRNSTTGGRLYVDGVLVLTFDPTLEPGSLVTTAPLRIGNHDTVGLNCFFNGVIDEITIFERAISSAEVNDIVAAGAAGKCGMVTPPATVCSPPLGAQLFVAGIATNTFLGTTNWQPGGLIFTATSTNTIVNLAPLNTNSPSGVWVDSFVLYESAGPRYVLPEESLDVLTGENAYGNWKLEVWDSRAGALLTTTALVDWQMQFVFQTNTPLPGVLPPGVPQTNSVPPGGIVYYVVDVPAWAQYATNRLLFASNPLNVLFNQNTPPAIGAANAGDLLIIGPAPTGSYTLSTVGVPPLLPGQRYYLGVHNPGATTVTFALQVDYDITALTNGVPINSTLGTGSLPRYFYYDISTNATAASFRLFGLNGNVDMVARRDAPLPTLSSFDYGSFNAGLNNEDIVLLTNSVPVPLTSGRWYLGVFNRDIAPVTYNIVATEFTNAFPNIVTLTNAIPYAKTNSGAGNGLDYYRFVVSSNSVRAQFEINMPSDDVTLVARKGLPLPDLGIFDYISANVFTNDELIVIMTNSAPVVLSAGDWFLTAVNLVGTPVTYSIKATEFDALEVRPLRITGFSYSLTNFCITWDSIPGVSYFVQGKPDLNLTNWTAVSPPIIATANSTTFCVPLPSPSRFFRVGEGLVLSTFVPPPRLRNITVTTNGTRLTWNGPVTSTYNVQWTPTLFPPTWNTFTNTITSATGLFQFLDDGTQTGGFGVSRYYRLILLP